MCSIAENKTLNLHFLAFPTAHISACLPAQPRIVFEKLHIFRNWAQGLIIGDLKALSHPQFPTVYVIHNWMSAMFINSFRSTEQE
jgi:hypothetical protein